MRNYKNKYKSLNNKYSIRSNSMSRNYQSSAKPVTGLKVPV